MIQFKKAQSPQAFAIARELFRAYAKELGIDLSFQDFERELENVEQQYSAPSGALMIVYGDERQAIACFGIRKLDQKICELKRMYIEGDFRGKGIGKQMLEVSFDEARNLGYKKMRLDTLPSMKSAIRLYKKYGFYEIEPYRFNPIEGSLYLEKKLI